MTEATIIQLTIYQLIGIILSIIGLILIPLIVFLWKIVEKRNDRIEEDIKTIRDDISKLKERMRGVETKIDDLPHIFEKELRKFENRILRGGSND